MEYRVKVTVLDKKLFSELQTEYCAVPDSGKCPCYNVGDEFMFYRNDERDDYWHMGAGTLTKCGKPDESVLLSPGTMHCGTEGVPFCSEAWDCISRYIYAALQGGAIMHGWTNDDKVMIACCNDGTRPVIFKIERIDVED
ncbi:MAG: TIGR04076 family protein [Acutalibacteraceae bacterium]